MLGDLIIKKILDKTKKGINKFGNPFPKYNPEYAKEKGSSKVNLKLDDEMLRAMSIVRSTPNSITVGYKKADPQAGKCAGNQSGSYGQPSRNLAKQRPFIGLTEKEKTLIIAKVDQKSRAIKVRTLAQEHISSLIRKQGEDL